MLAYDQGFEHGPVDFNEKNIDPTYIMNVAREAGVFTGIIFHEGVAARYYDATTNIPLVVKLNGRTAYRSGEEPYSPLLCTVKRAVELGASGVGYTIYVGSEHEAKMMEEFSKMEDEAHAAGLTVIAWMYPRGKKVEGVENNKETVAYAARLGLELNADMVKVPYVVEPGGMKWVVEAAGKTKVVIQGGGKKEWTELEAEVKSAMNQGVAGLAVGRNVWQAENPAEVARNLSQLVFV